MKHKHKQAGPFCCHRGPRKSTTQQKGREPGNKERHRVPSHWKINGNNAIRIFGIWIDQFVSAVINANILPGYSSENISNSSSLTSGILRKFGWTLLLFIGLGTQIADANTFTFSYKSRQQWDNVTLEPGIHWFVVNGVPKYLDTRWRVGAEVWETDWHALWSYDAKLKVTVTDKNIGGRFEVVADFFKDSGDKNFAHNTGWNVKVNKPNQAPSRPGTLSSKDVTDTEAVVSWGKSTDQDSNLKHYQVQIQEDDLNPFWRTVGYYSTTSVKLTNLKKGTSYHVRVRAIDTKEAKSSYREKLNLFTTKSNQPPSKPSNVVFNNVDEHNASLAWLSGVDPEGSKVRTVLEYKVHGAGSWISKTIEGTSVKLSGLTSGTLYSIRLKSLDDSQKASAWLEIPNGFTTLTNGRRIMLESKQFAVSTNSPLSFAFRYVDDNGQSVANVPVHAEDGLRLMSRELGNTDASGKFRIDYSAFETQEQGLYHVTVFAPKAKLTVVFAIFSENDPTLSMLETSQGFNLGPVIPGSLDPVQMAMIPSKSGWELAGSTADSLLTAGHYVADFSVDWLSNTGKSFIENPVNWVAVAGSATCVIPTPASPVVCPVSLGFIRQSVTTSAVTAFAETAVDRSNLSEKDKALAKAGISAGSAFYSFAKLNHKEGLKFGMEFAATEWDIMSATVKTVDAIGTEEEMAMELICRDPNGDLDIITAVFPKPTLPSEPEKECKIVLTSSELPVPWEGLSDIFPVQKTGQCNIQPLADVSWIHVGQIDWNGTPLFEYAIEKNNKISPRSGSINLGENVIVVNQEARVEACNPIMEWTGPTIGFNGSTESISISAEPECSWSLNADTDITFIDSKAGTGPSVVSFSVEPNLSDHSRVLTIQLNDQLAHIQQDGKPVDKEIPTITLESHSDGLIVNENHVAVSGKATDNIAVSSVTVNSESADVTEISGKQTVTWSLNVALKEGENRIDVKATDRNGNESETTSITIKYQPVVKNPEAPSIEISNDEKNGLIEFLFSEFSSEVAEDSMQCLEIQISDETDFEPLTLAVDCWEDLAFSLSDTEIDPGDYFIRARFHSVLGMKSEWSITQAFKVSPVQVDVILSSIISNQIAPGLMSTLGITGKGLPFASLQGSISITGPGVFATEADGTPLSDSTLKGIHLQISSDKKTISWAWFDPLLQEHVLSEGSFLNLAILTDENTAGKELKFKFADSEAGVALEALDANGKNLTISAINSVVLIEEGRVISGTINGPDGNSVISGLPVKLIREGILVNTVKTDNTGQFEFDGLEENGVYNVIPEVSWLSSDKNVVTIGDAIQSLQVLLKKTELASYAFGALDVVTTLTPAISIADTVGIVKIALNPEQTTFRAIGVGADKGDYDKISVDLTSKFRADASFRIVRLGDGNLDPEGIVVKAPAATKQAFRGPGAFRTSSVHISDRTAKLTLGGTVIRPYESVAEIPVYLETFEGLILGVDLMFSNDQNLEIVDLRSQDDALRIDYQISEHGLHASWIDYSLEGRMFDRNQPMFHLEAKLNGDTQSALYMDQGALVFEDDLNEIAILPAAAVIYQTDNPKDRFVPIIGGSLLHVAPEGKSLIIPMIEGFTKTIERTPSLEPDIPWETYLQIEGTREIKVVPLLEKIDTKSSFFRVK